MQNPRKILSFQYFIYSSHAKSLYRDFMKLTQRIGDSGTKSELRQQIRERFEANRQVEDTNVQKRLIAEGKKELQLLQRNVNLSL